MRGVNYVFHAAALKQVPSCEFYPSEALKTNALGTENTIDAAIANNVEKVIILSTDKAVYPVNAMGISKAMMEKIAKSYEKPDTIICRTRYGNVLGSRGSILPMFIDQINRDQKVTVTNPNMTRFIMTLDDAVDLVLYAFERRTRCTESTCLHYRRPVKALFIIKGKDTGCEYIGERHGEKKHEVLLSKEEMRTAEDLGRFFKVDMSAYIKLQTS